MCCSIFFLFFTTSVKSINKFFKCSNNSKPSVSSFFFSALQNSLLKASVLCSDLNSCFLAWCKLSSWGFLYCSPLLVSICSSSFMWILSFYWNMCLNSFLLPSYLYSMILACFLLSNPANTEISASGYFVSYCSSVGFPSSKSLLTILVFFGLL